MSNLLISWIPRLSSLYLRCSQLLFFFYRNFVTFSLVVFWYTHLFLYPAEIQVEAGAAWPQLAKQLVTGCLAVLGGEACSAGVKIQDVVHGGYIFYHVS